MFHEYKTVLLEVRINKYFFLEVVKLLMELQEKQE